MKELKEILHKFNKALVKGKIISVEQADDIFLKIEALTAPVNPRERILGGYKPTMDNYIAREEDKNDHPDPNLD